MRETTCTLAPWSARCEMRQKQTGGGTTSTATKTGDMIEIILGLAWMDKCKAPDHQMWRDAVEDLVRKTEKLVNLIQRTHHRYFAQRVKQALLRITNA